MSIFGSDGIRSGVGGARFQGKTTGGPDGNEIRLEGNIGLFVVTTPALAGECQTDHCDHKGTDERFPHQFPHFYGSWYKHLSTNIVNYFWYYLTVCHKF